MFDYLVVELFNVVRKQQKSLQAKLQEAGSSEVKKSKGTHIQLSGDTPLLVFPLVLPSLLPLGREV